MALKPGQKMPPAAPSSPRASAATRGVPAKANRTLPSIWAAHAGEDDAPGTEPVDEGSCRTDYGHTGDGRHCQQAAGGLDREPAHLVQIDESERQHQTGAERLDGDRR